MAEQEPAAPAPKPRNWLKALLGTLGGLLSGAIMMYITPLVNQVVKPPKPVANFEVHDDGLKVQFHNLSKYGEGNWDFGDGSPLVKTAPDQFAEHTYLRPGDYTVKLSLRNPFGDENERAVPVHVEAAAATTAATTTPPKVLSLEAIPVSAGSYAPATFKLVSNVQNAQYTVLDLGDGRPWQGSADSGEKVQLVTFQKPGGYLVKLGAFNGTQYGEKSEIISVMEAPSNSLTAMLTVTDVAMWVDTKTHPATFSAAIPAGSSDASYPFTCEVRPCPGHTLVDLAVKTKDGQEVRLGTHTGLSLDTSALGLTNVSNLHLVRGDDNQSVRLTGELLADPKDKNAPTSLMLPVELTVQKKIPVTQTIPVTTTLNVPTDFSSGTLMLPPVQKGCVDCQRKYHLEVLNNGTKIYEDSQLQRSALVTLPNRKLILTTTLTNDQLRIDLIDAPTGVTKATP